MTAPGPAWSSRECARAAGWITGDEDSFEPGAWHGLMENPALPAKKPSSWMDPRVLWACRNDKLARWFSDPIPFERSRWVQSLGESELMLTSPEDARRFLLMGDTGEGDQSQFAVAAVLAEEKGAGFALICSDTQYPVGDVDDFERKFYRPYRTVELPIYGIPGNHDWYDDLQAFQYHFAGRTPERRATFAEDRAGTGHPWWRVWLRRRFWKKPGYVTADAERARAQRNCSTARAQSPQQQAPYYAMDVGPVRFVCIDTGILGDIDPAQADWLIRVSDDDRPKVLLTGKPLFVDGRVDPCQMHIEHWVTDTSGERRALSSVLDVVHHAPFHYLGSIGGDIHNYQRYPVVLDDGRRFQHVVSGGGGAFMHATHLIESMDGKAEMTDHGVTEKTFRCYPLRMDSLAVYSEVLGRMLRWKRTILTPGEAAKIVYAARMVEVDGGNVPPRVLAETADAVRWLPGLVGHVVLRVGGQRFHKFFSPFFAWNFPPFFRHFLRIEVDGDDGRGQVRVTCVAVPGYAEHEADPPEEDTFTMSWGQPPAAP